MPPPRDLTGQKFTRLTALRCIGVEHHNRMWECACECGATFIAPANRLVFGNTRSCGCIAKEKNRKRLKANGYYTAKVVQRNKERATHGHARRGGKTRTYRIWCGLTSERRREVCVHWGDYLAFLADMGECPSPSHTIDRIDNLRGYEPGNCRWATMKEQQNNRTNNRRITANGERLTLAQWSDHTGIGRNVIARRLDLLGWEPERAVSVPSRPMKKRNGRRG